jgi:hypothetical protein
MTEDLPSIFITKKMAKKNAQFTVLKNKERKDMYTNNYDLQKYYYNTQNTYVNNSGNGSNDGTTVNAADDIKEKKVNLEDILDRVEEGDVSVLIELGISYTQFNEGDVLKISFKYLVGQYILDDRTQTPKSRS